MRLDYKYEWLFLFDYKKHLNATSFTSVVGSIGAVGVVFNYTLQKATQEKINNKKLVAELIAKSRIEWLKEMRELVSEYMSLSNQASFYAEQNLKKIYGSSPLELEKYNTLVREIEVYYHQILFNLNKDESISKSILEYKDIFNISNLYTIESNREQISKEILKLSEEDLNKIPEEYPEAPRMNLDNFNNNSMQTIKKYRYDIQAKVGNEVQSYFKKEWDKAKEEIKSGKVARPDIQEK